MAIYLSKRHGEVLVEHLTYDVIIHYEDGESVIIGMTNFEAYVLAGEFTYKES